MDSQMFDGMVFGLIAFGIAIGVSIVGLICLCFWAFHHIGITWN